MKLVTHSLLGERPVRQMLIATFLASAATGIASILIPWILIKEFSGDVFSILATATTFMVIFFMPMIGRTIDRLKRKNILVATSCGGCLFFLILSFLEAGNLIYSICLLAAFVLMQLYYNVFFTTRSALAQSLTRKENYGRLNGWLEIENQTAAFSAGTLAVLLLDVLAIQTIFLVCVLSLLLAALFFYLIPEKDRNDGKEIKINKNEKLHFDLSLLLLVQAGNIPFVCIMLMNIVKPIFVSDVLLANAQVLAMTGVFYTVGAITTGGLSSWLMNKIGAFNSLVLAVFGFVIASASLIVISTVEILYAASLGWGIFNSLARISKQTIAMEIIPNEEIGRFMAYSQKITLFIRGMVILGFSSLFLFVEYSYSFWYVTAIALAGPILLLVRKRKITSPSVPAR